MDAFRAAMTDIQNTITANLNLRFMFNNCSINSWTDLPGPILKKCTFLRQTRYVHTPVTAVEANTQHIREAVRTQIAAVIQPAAAGAAIQPAVGAAVATVLGSQSVHNTTVTTSAQTSLEVIRAYIAEHQLTVPDADWLIFAKRTYIDRVSLYRNLISAVTNNEKTNNAVNDNTVPNNASQQLYNRVINKYPNIHRILKRWIEPGDGSYGGSARNTRHSVSKLTYREMFALVWCILEHKHSQSNDDLEIFGRLSVEMEDGDEKCFTGQYTRLINSLVGVVDGVNVGISSAETVQLTVSAMLDTYRADTDHLDDRKATDIKKRMVRYRQLVCDIWAQRSAHEMDPIWDPWVDAVIDMAPDPIVLTQDKFVETWDGLVIDIECPNDHVVIGVYDDSLNLIPLD
jgi:hypothetical protein